MLIQHHLIVFNDQNNVTFLHDGQPYICIQTIAQHLGLNWATQQKRINNNPVLSKALLIESAPITTDIDVALDNPARRSIAGLPIHLLNGWLFSLNVQKPALKKILIAYQTGLYQCLADYWYKDIAVKDGLFDETMATLNLIKTMAGSIPAHKVAVRVEEFITMNMHMIKGVKEELKNILFDREDFLKNEDVGTIEKCSHSDTREAI